MTVDPESGKSVEQFLQTKVDPTSGKTSQILLPLSSGTVDSQHGESNSFLLTLIVLTCMTINICFSGNGPPQIFETIDPFTGQTIQQIVQNQVNPSTGETMQTLIPIPTSHVNSNPCVQVITGGNPVNGEQIFHPLSGSTSQTILPSPIVNSPATQIVQDPSTGNLMQQVVQMPEPKQALLPFIENPSSSLNNLTTVVQDPVTGQVYPQNIQTPPKDPARDQNSKLPSEATQTSIIDLLYRSCCMTSDCFFTNSLFSWWCTTNHYNH